MLSKLRAAAVCTATAALPADLMRSLHECFPGVKELRPVSGGTLGACFVGQLKGEWRVFKTHRLDGGNLALEREARILAALWGSRVDVRWARFGRGVGSRLWVHMKRLDSRRDLSASAVRQLALCASDSLTSSAASSLVPRSDDLAKIVAEAEPLLRLLEHKKLLSPRTRRLAAYHVDNVSARIATWPMVLCHGDLGPANILWDSEGPLAIDWEDACWGVKGYDYLYWLTFFVNRRWLVRESLGHTVLGIHDEISLMVVIMLLKCGLSVATGEYRIHSISCDQRLGEVLRLNT